MTRPQITATTHTLPFDKLSPSDFERLCLWLVKREGWQRPEHLGAAGSEQGRDVIGWKATNKGEQLWFFQCKRYKSIGAATLTKEVDKYNTLPPAERPHGIVFVTNAVVSRKSRYAVTVHCRKHGYECEFWAHTELDERVKAYPDLVKEFFDLHLDPVSLTLRPDFAGRIANFLNLYLGTSDHTVPFGGRDEVLDDLDQWLENPKATPYQLLVAPAGRGKSALLARWFQRLLGREGLEVVFFPISARFRTNLASVVFSGLAARLAQLHAEPVPTNPHLTAEQWRDIMHQYLRRSLPNGKWLLVILDGVDEAANWDVGTDLFPLNPPKMLRVVIAARLRPNDSDGIHWQRAFGWEDKPRLANTRTLEPLSSDGVADVLRRMGFPLDQLSERVDIVSELYRLSEGDPLLANLYIRDLWKMREQAVRLKPDDLRNIQPGLGGYFDRWWEDQRLLWGKQVREREEVANQLLDTLACALGPLNQEDLLLLSGLRKRLLTDALRALSRFVIGDGKQGFICSHSRLANYFYEEHLGDQERRSCEERFLAWGRRTLEGLEDDSSSPKDASAYIVQYYGAHLERYGASPAELLGFSNQGWQKAWDAFEGTYSGFLNDVNRTWKACEQADRIALDASKTPLHLGHTIRCALIHASINSLSANIPDALIVALVTNRIWTPTQALTYARHKPNPDAQIRATASIVSYLPDVVRTEVISEAFRIAKDLHGEANQADAIAVLAPHLERNQLIEAWMIATEFKIEHHRVEAIPAVARQLGEDYLAQAWKMALDETNPYAKAKALFGLAPHLTTEQLVEAWAIAGTLEYEEARAQALAALAAFLGPERVAEAWQFVNTERSIGCAEVLGPLARCLNPSQLSDAWIWLCTVSGWSEQTYENVRIPALKVVAECLRPDQLVKAWQVALDWKITRYPMEPLAALAPHMNPSRVAELLAIARMKCDRRKNLNDTVANILTLLTPYLERDDLAEALVIARKLGDGDFWAEKLVAMIRDVGTQELTEAWTQAKNLINEHDRTRAQCALACRSGKERLSEAWVMVRQVEDDRIRAWALSVLAQDLDLEQIAEAWSWIKTMADERERSQAFSSLIPYLDHGLLAEAWHVANEMKGEGVRSNALVALAPYLKPNQLLEAWTWAVSMKYLLVHKGVLHALAPHLKPKQVTIVLGELGKNAKEDVDIVVEEVCAALAPFLDQAGLRQALEMAKRLRSSSGEALAEQELEFSMEGLQRLLEKRVKRGSSSGRALAALAPYLPPDLLQEAWRAVKRTSDKGSRILALCHLAPHLGREEVDEAFTAIWDLDMQYWDEALAILSSKLNTGQLSIVLERVAEMQKLPRTTEVQRDFNSANALSAIAPYLKGELQDKAWELARGFYRLDWRAKALSSLASSRGTAALSEALMANDEGMASVGGGNHIYKLAPYLNECQLIKAWSAIIQMIAGSNDGDTRQWQGELAALVPHLKPVSDLQKYEKLGETLHVLSHKKRFDLLEGLEILTPLIHSLGNSRAVNAVIHAVIEVANRWP